MSVTEREIRAGVKDSQDLHKTCLWFKRKFVDIDLYQPSKILSKYYGKRLKYTVVRVKILW